MNQHQKTKNPYIDPSVMKPQPQIQPHMRRTHQPQQPQQPIQQKNYHNQNNNKFGHKNMHAHNNQMQNMQPMNNMNNYYSQQYAQYQVPNYATNNYNYNNFGFYAQNMGNNPMLYNSGIKYAQDIPIDPLKVNPYTTMNMYNGKQQQLTQQQYYNNANMANINMNMNVNNINNGNNNFGNSAQRACREGNGCYYHKLGKCIWFHKNKIDINCFNGPNCSIKDKANKFGTICGYNHKEFNQANKDQSIKLGTGNDISNNNNTTPKKSIICKTGDNNCVFNKQGRCYYIHNNKKSIFCINGPACMYKAVPNKFGNICQYNHTKFNQSNVPKPLNTKSSESKDDEKDNAPKTDDNNTDDNNNNAKKPINQDNNNNDNKNIKNNEIDSNKNTTIVK